MVSKKICRGCCHWRRQRTGVLGPHCGFLMDTGYSRIGQMTGEQRKSGECPFFEKGRQRKTTVKPFIVSPDPLSRLSYGLPGIPKPRRTKYDEDKILTLYDQGKSDKEIAAALECSAEAIRGWRRRRELPANFPRAPSLDTRGVRELYMAGLNDGEIARRVGCTRNAVYVWRKRERLPANYGKEDHNGGAADHDV